jgi:hypothetical protein
VNPNRQQADYCPSSWFTEKQDLGNQRDLAVCPPASATVAATSLRSSILLATRPRMHGLRLAPAAEGKGAGGAEPWCFGPRPKPTSMGAPRAAALRSLIKTKSPFYVFPAHGAAASCALCRVQDAYTRSRCGNPQFAYRCDTSGAGCIAVPKQ